MGLLQNFDPSNIGASLLELALRLIIVLIALTFHETAHGWMAAKLGDPTAKAMGRLSLNPLKHLDPIGFLCMLLFRFGWAKPVPVDPRNFKNPKRDMALTALAGPVSNLLLAFVILIPFEILRTLLLSGVFAIRSEFGVNLFLVFYNFVYSFHFLNITLAIFNFIPVPPLDGSRVLLAVLPARLYFGVMRYERWLSLGIMLLLVLGVLDGPLTFLAGAVSSGMSWILNLLPFIGG